MDRWIDGQVVGNRSNSIHMHICAIRIIKSLQGVIIFFSQCINSIFFTLHHMAPPLFLEQLSHLLWFISSAIIQYENPAVCYSINALGPYSVQTLWRIKVKKRSRSWWRLCRMAHFPSARKWQRKTKLQSCLEAHRPPTHWPTSADMLLTACDLLKVTFLHTQTRTYTHTLLPPLLFLSVVFLLPHTQIFSQVIQIRVLNVSRLTFASGQHRGQKVFSHHVTKESQRNCSSVWTVGHDPNEQDWSKCDVSTSDIEAI